MLEIKCKKGDLFVQSKYLDDICIRRMKTIKSRNLRGTTIRLPLWHFLLVKWISLPVLSECSTQLTSSPAHHHLLINVTSPEVHIPCPVYYSVIYELLVIMRRAVCPIYCFCISDVYQVLDL